MPFAPRKSFRASTQPEALASQALKTCFPRVHPLGFTGADLTRSGAARSNERRAYVEKKLAEVDAKMQ
eukprot:6167847-Pleurochrysis_carterae.AAC.1